MPDPTLPYPPLPPPTALDRVSVDSSPPTPATQGMECSEKAQELEGHLEHFKRSTSREEKPRYRLEGRFRDKFLDVVEPFVDSAKVFEKAAAVCVLGGWRRGGWG